MDNRLKKTSMYSSIYFERLESSQQVADEIRSAVTIFAGHRTTLSMIEAFLMGTGQASIVEPGHRVSPL